MFDHERNERLRRLHIGANRPFHQWRQLIERKQAEGLTAEQMAEDEQVKGCFVISAIGPLLAIGSIIEAIMATISFIEWLRGKGFVALALIVAMCLVAFVLWVCLKVWVFA